MSSERAFNVKMEDGLGIITFDVIGSPMNTWSEDTVTEFLELLEDLKKDETLKGLIFISGKPKAFFAGADLKLFTLLKTREETEKAISYFRNAFDEISALKIPTMAAIQGFCVGGGLELTLACTARIAKDSKTTMLGLPECNVGLFPGAGGSQRLPRMIGYPAIDLMLDCNFLNAEKAYQIGMVDRFVPADGDLLEEAKTFLKEIISGKAQLKRPEYDFSDIDNVAEQARQKVLKKTRGRELPGLMLCIKSVQDGLKLSLEEGLKLEGEYFIDSILSDEAKGSINTFFLKNLTDKPKKMMTRGFEPKSLKKAAVLGLGTMGRGIVIDILRNMQIPVVVKDIPEALEPGKAFVKKIFDGMAEKKKLKTPVDDLMNLLTVTSEYGDDFKDVDIVVEAVFEDIKVKEQVYKELCDVVTADCLIVSNTSSLPIDAMSQYVTNPDRFGGLHFFSPVWMMQLVEVIRGEKTSQETIDNLLNFTALIRKRPIVCKDNPGFVVNAMLFPYLLHALQYIEEGNAIEKVDGALTAFGMPVGPIRLTDEVGIDVPYKIFVGMGVEQQTLKNIVENGRLGLKKSGKGFFLKDGNVDPEVLSLIAKKELRERTEEEIQTGLLGATVNVARDLLDNEVVSDPRMIDVGMIWATGFPSDKGGPLKWADLIGLSEKLFGKKFYKD